MQKLDLLNRAICVVKLDSMKFNYFVTAVHSTKHSAKLYIMKSLVK